MININWNNLMGYSVGEGDNSILFWALLLFNRSAFSTFVGSKIDRNIPIRFWDLRLKSTVLRVTITGRYSDITRLDDPSYTSPSLLAPSSFLLKPPSFFLHISLKSKHKMHIIIGIIQIQNNAWFWQKRRQVRT